MKKKHSAPKVVSTLPALRLSVVKSIRLNTSFKDLSLIRSGDEVGNISFNKDTNNIEGEEKDDGENEEKHNKEIFIKDENTLNISFNDI